MTVYVLGSMRVNARFTPISAFQQKVEDNFTSANTGATRKRFKTDSSVNPVIPPLGADDFGILTTDDSGANFMYLNSSYRYIPYTALVSLSKPATVLDRNGKWPESGTILFQEFVDWNTTANDATKQKAMSDVIAACKSLISSAATFFPASPKLCTQGSLKTVRPLSRQELEVFGVEVPSNIPFAVVKTELADLPGLAKRAFDKYLAENEFVKETEIKFDDVSTKEGSTYSSYELSAQLKYKSTGTFNVEVDVYVLYDDTTNMLRLTDSLANVDSTAAAAISAAQKKLLEDAYAAASSRAAGIDVKATLTKPAALTKLAEPLASEVDAWWSNYLRLANDVNAMPLGSEDAYNAAKAGYQAANPDATQTYDQAVYANAQAEAKDKLPGSSGFSGLWEAVKGAGSATFDYVKTWSPLDMAKGYAVYKGTSTAAGLTERYPWLLPVAVVGAAVVVLK